MGGLFGSHNTVTEAEKVSQFQINSATYGEVVPIVLGTTRISGNIIDYYNFTAIDHSQTTRTGKGGGSSQTNITYTYKAAVLIGLGEGPVDGIDKVWKDTDTITTLADIGLTLFKGDYGQSPWAYTETNNPDHALPYSGLAYVAGYIDLNSSGGVPNLNFELKGQLLDTGDGIDVNPADAIVFITSNAYNGIGLNSDNIHADGLSRLRTFAKAADLLVTLPLTDQTKAYEIINSLCEALNTIVFWSQSKLKFVPRCDEEITGSGVTYTPNTAPLYDLDDDDFLADDDGRHVTFERTDNAETYNQATVEFINRANSYETETTDYQILSDINKRGFRPMSTKTYHFFHTKARAHYVAQVHAMKSCFGRNIYKIKLGWTHCLLEPGDIVTLTDPVLGLNKLPVIIESWEESEDEEGFEVEASPLLAGTYSPARYPTYEAERAQINRFINPGNVNPPVIFEPPDKLGSGLTVWIGVSGGLNWGGCEVWVSDDTETYKHIGTINSPARQGVLVKTLMAGNDPDSINTLTVDMSLSRRELLSGTQSDADNYNTLCFVDGELIAYENAKLIGANKYELSYLRRGAYNTAITNHDPNTQFLRIDTDALFSYPFTSDDVGKTIYLKFTSRNTFGVAEQSLADVEAYTYVLKGSALNSSLPVVENLTTKYSNGFMELSWNAVSDFRSPIMYEIRKGSSPSNAQIVTRTLLTSYVVQGDGMYWIAAYYHSDQASAYSSEWTSVEITGSRVPQNVIATFDEKETGWQGILSGTAAVANNLVKVSPISNGTYQIPTSHVVDIGVAAICNISMSYSAVGDTNSASSDDIPNVDLIANWDGDYASFVNITPQIRLADNGGVFGEWQDFFAGQYFGRKFDFQIKLQSLTANVNAVLNAMTFSVDVPDLSESKTVDVPAGGASFVYETNFHAIPKPQITIFNAEQGDTIVLTNQTLNGFSLQITNNGVGVARTINYFAQKY